MSTPTTFEAAELYINRIYTQFCSITISWSRAIDWLRAKPLREVNCSAASTSSRRRSSDLHNRFVLISIALIILIASNWCRSLLLAFLGQLEVLFKLRSCLPGMFYLLSFSCFCALLLKSNFLCNLPYTLPLLQYTSFLLLLSLLKLSCLIFLELLSLLVGLFLCLARSGLIYFRWRPEDSTTVVLRRRFEWESFATLPALLLI
jgi:hypothetical protein